MWFVPIFFLLLGLAKVLYRKRMAYILGFGLAPALAKLTGSLLPISVAGILPSPWGLIPNTLLWAGIGYIIGPTLNLLDQGSPTPYTLTAVWGVLLAVNWQVAFLVTQISLLILGALLFLTAMKMECDKKLKEINYISVDPSEGLLPPLMKWGILLIALIITGYLAITASASDPNNLYHSTQWGIVLGLLMSLFWSIGWRLTAQHVKIFKGYIWRSVKRDTGP